jgi:Ca2+-binding EF-hand superfamily protein
MDFALILAEPDLSADSKLFNQLGCDVMNWKLQAVMVSLGCFLASGVSAQEEREAKRSKVLERFDADGDGKLSDKEKARAKRAKEKRSAQSPEERKARMQALLKRFDTDGDGKLSKEEKSKLREAKAKSRQDKGKRAKGKKGKGAGSAERKARLLKRFDSDGDGKLSEQERAAARKARAERGQDGEARERKRAMLLKRFDSDGDGKLSPSERDAAREKLQNRPERKGQPKRSPSAPERRA